MRLGIKDFVFVGIQLVLFVAYIFDIDFWGFGLPHLLKTVFLIASFLGLVVIVLSIAQLNTNLSPFPTPKTGSNLITTGLYKFSRHPIYSGILITLFSYALYATSSYKLIVTLALLLLFYLKSAYEEKRLLNAFSDYKKYKDSTGRFFPKF